MGLAGSAVADEVCDAGEDYAMSMAALIDMWGGGPLDLFDCTKGHHQCEVQRRRAVRMGCQLVENAPGIAEQFDARCGTGIAAMIPPLREVVDAMLEQVGATCANPAPR